ncbi:unnamed protein product, partial [Cyprideis torosa]
MMAGIAQDLASTKGDVLAEATAELQGVCEEGGIYEGPGSQGVPVSVGGSVQQFIEVPASTNVVGSVPIMLDGTSAEALNGADGTSRRLIGVLDYTTEPPTIKLVTIPAGNIQGAVEGIQISAPIAQTQHISVSHHQQMEGHPPVLTPAPHHQTHQVAAQPSQHQLQQQTSHQQQQMQISNATSSSSSVAATTPVVRGTKTVAGATNRAKKYNGYIFYSKEQRNNIINELNLQDKSFGEVSKIVGQKWRQLPFRIQQLYENIALERCQRALETGQPIDSDIRPEESPMKDYVPGKEEDEDAALTNWDCRWGNCGLIFPGQDHLVTHCIEEHAKVLSQLECKWSECKRAMQSNHLPFQSFNQLVKHIKEIHIHKMKLAKWAEHHPEATALKPPPTKKSRSSQSAAAAASSTVQPPEQEMVKQEMTAGNVIYHQGQPYVIDPATGQGHLATPAAQAQGKKNGTASPAATVNNGLFQAPAAEVTILRRGNQPAQSQQGTQMIYQQNQSGHLVQYEGLDAEGGAYLSGSGSMQVQSPNYAQNQTQAVQGH